MHSSKTLALTFSRSGGCKPFPADRRQFTWYSCHRANSGTIGAQSARIYAVLLFPSTSFVPRSGNITLTTLLCAAWFCSCVRQAPGSGSRNAMRLAAVNRSYFHPYRFDDFDVFDCHGIPFKRVSVQDHQIRQFSRFNRTLRLLLAILVGGVDGYGFEGFQRADPLIGPNGHAASGDAVDRGPKDEHLIEWCDYKVGVVCGPQSFVNCSAHGLS